MKQRTSIQCVTALALLCTAAFGHSAFADSGGHDFDDGMKQVLAGYIPVQEALAGDSFKGVAEAAKSIAASAATLDASKLTDEHAEHYKSLPEQITSASNEVAKATTIEQAREAFKRLSRPMAMWASMSDPEGVSVFSCSMADASWLQRSGDIKNPYYGSSMLGCGELVSSAADSK